LFPDEVDYQVVKNDEIIFGLRKRLRDFLKSSIYYLPCSLLDYIPPEFMLEEVILVLARNKEYTQAFSLCMTDLSDPYFAEEICLACFALTKDEGIFFSLY
jgi:hypothetical protein